MIPAILSFFSDVPAGDPCVHSFLGLTPWYQYLNLRPFPDCSVYFVNGNGLVSSSNWAELWLIAIALLDDLLKVAGVVALAFVIYGGFRYVTSQGNPEHTKNALSTIIDALIGLAIAAVATAVVDFLGTKLGASSATVNGIPNVVADSSTFSTVLDIVFGILGGISVIMIIFGGFKYTTSRGEPQATAQAKDTILYAIIGLVVAIFATAIVNFVLIQFH